VKPFFFIAGHACFGKAAATSRDDAKWLDFQQFDGWMADR
jgi:hypothetical protein